jgi:hypothetical protein
MDSVALTSGVRSGRLAASIGVGTVTMYTLQSRMAATSEANDNRVAAASRSGSTSSVLSWPRWSSSMRARSMSKPTVAYCLPNSTASGRPT